MDGPFSKFSFCACPKYFGGPLNAIQFLIRPKRFVLKSNGLYLQPSKSSQDPVVVMKIEFLCPCSKAAEKILSCFSLDTEATLDLSIYLLCTNCIVTNPIITFKIN